MRSEQIGDATPWVRIYALCEYPETPRYVGKTARWLHERHKQHIRAAKIAKLPVQRWMLKQIEQRKPLMIKLLENVPPTADWQEREAFWIAKLRAEGADLLNLTTGGEGFHGLIRSAECRAKIAAALRTGGTFSCEACGAQFWRKLKEIKKGHNRFCSRRCYSASLRGVSRPVPRVATERGLMAAAAKRRAQTRCPHGHELAGGNLFINRKGARVCIACRREASKRSRAKGGSQ